MNWITRFADWWLGNANTITAAVGINTPDGFVPLIIKGVRVKINGGIITSLYRDHFTAQHYMEPTHWAYKNARDEWIALVMKDPPSLVLGDSIALSIKIDIM